MTGTAFGLRRASPLWLSLTVLLAVSPLAAQDPIHQLKSVVLARPIVDTTATDEKQWAELKRFHAMRERELREIIDKQLTTFDDLREALALKEWCDVARSEREDPELVAVDARMRFRIAERFRAGVRGIVEFGLSDSRAAVANLVVELSLTVRAAPDPALPITTDEASALRRAGFARSLTDEIVRLLAADSELVRMHAMRALGGMNAEPRRVAPILAARLKSSDVKVRRAAADGLFRVIATASYLKDQAFKAPPVWASDVDVLIAATEVVRHAPAGLADQDALVRWCCAEALRMSAQALTAHFQRAARDAHEVKLVAHVHSPAEIDAVKRLLGAFEKTGPALASALPDTSVEVRLAVVQTLDQLSNLRCCLAAEATSGGELPQRAALIPPQASDPLANFARGDWRAASKLLDDPDARVRRATVGFLEFFAEAQPEAVPALTKSLVDKDRFVRWAAARALSRFSPRYQPRDAAVAVPVLARSLFDTDVAVRLAAAATLESIGPHAAPAVSHIANAIDFGDVENRVAVMRIITAIGPERAQAAVPTLTAALNHDDPRVRSAAALTLGKYGPLARVPATVTALRRALGDPDQQVRIHASEATRRILDAAKQ